MSTQKLIIFFCFLMAVLDESLSSSSSEQYDYIKTYFFKQKLDHFNASDNATWNQRYFVNAKYYVPGGPIFLYQCGESSASVERFATYAWGALYPKAVGAMTIQLEHRYFGESQPASDTSVENLQYLTIEQAVADAGNFVANAKKLFNYQPKWIVFGGSYSGALAVWIREKYPDLLYGAISSSGPVNPVVNFTQYYDTISKDYEQNSTECSNGIKEGFESLQKIFTSEKDLMIVNRIFNICEPISMNDTKNLQKFVYRLAANFGSMAQYSNDGSPPDPLNIAAICEVMGNKHLGSGLVRVAVCNDLFFGDGYPYCFQHMTYNAFMQELSETSWDSYAVQHGDRQWLYLICNQFGSLESSDGKESIFGSSFPLQFLFQRCVDVFGPDFTVKRLSENLEKIISNYGGYHPNTSNVLSIQGSLDPWKNLGICDNSTKGVTAIYIEGTAHCADQYPPTKYDSPQLKQARRQTIDYLGKLLTPSTYYPVNISSIVLPNFDNLNSI